MNELRLILSTMRVPFLILTPACIVLGIATATRATGTVNLSQSLLVLFGALAAHVSVNTFNEYFDFRSGLDSMTERTAFSGGSGTLPSQPDLAHMALLTAWAGFFSAALIGIYFVSLRGMTLLPLGVLGLVLVFAYTTWITRSPFLCLIAPGLGFGPVMVMGTHFALTGEYSWTALMTSLVPLFLVNNLLLLNQFPDVEADELVGRRHLSIVAGRRLASIVYALFLVCTYLVIIVAVSTGNLPRASLLALLSLVLAVPTSVGAFRHAEDSKRLVPFMGMNVVTTLVTPLLVAVGLFVG